MSNPVSFTHPAGASARRRSVLLAGLVAASLLLGACGSDDDSGAQDDPAVEVGGQDGATDGNGSDEVTPTPPAGEPTGDDRIRMVDSGFGTWPDRNDGVLTTGSGVELVNVSDETVTNVKVSISYMGEDGNKIGTSVGTIGAIEPGGVAHVGGAAHRTKVEPASLEVTVEADATATSAQVIAYDQEKLNRDDQALLNIVVGSITNPTDEEIEVALWCVIRSDGEIVASTQNDMIKVAPGATQVANASSGGIPGDTADCSASTLVR